MKKRVLAIIAGLFSLTGILMAQSYADVVIEYNSAVRCLNNQAYDSAFIYLNNTLSMSDVVGAEAAEMEKSSKEQLVYANYSQAYTFEKRKKYSEAIPYYEESIRLSEEYEVKEETAGKAKRKLVSTSMRAGQAEYSAKEYEAALAHYSKVLAMAPSVYQAHQGKGLVYEKLDQIDDMLGEFAIAKKKAAEKGDEKVLSAINAKINSYYHGLIDEELMMIDPEEADYSFLADNANVNATKALEEYQKNNDPKDLEQAEMWKATATKYVENEKRLQEQLDSGLIVDAILENIYEENEDNPYDEGESKVSEKPKRRAKIEEILGDTGFLEF